RSQRILSRIALASLLLPQALACGGSSKSSSSAPPPGSAAPPPSAPPSPPAPGQILPSDRSTDWHLAGIPGGIPNRTTVSATIDASTYAIGVTDETPALPNA